MIKNINKIEKFRNFLTFDATSTEIKKKSIFFAQNGTGKTNLSRLFKLVSNKQNMDHFLSQEANIGDKITFSILFNNRIALTDESNYTTQDNTNILVFNADFVEENVRGIDFSDKDMNGTLQLPLGISDIEVDRLEKLIVSQVETRRQIYDQLSKKINETITAIKNDRKNIFSGKDMSIWSEFKIEKIIDSNFVTIVPNNQAEFASCVQDLSSLSNLDEDLSIKKDIPLLALDTVRYSIIESLLLEKKIFPVFDNDIKTKMEDIMREWLISKDSFHTGIDISKNHGKCILCDRPTDSSTNDLFQRYIDYFNNEVSKFDSEIDKLIAELSQFLSICERINNNKQSDVDKYSALLGLTDKWIVIDTEGIIALIKDGIEKLDLKKQNPDSVYTFDAHNFTVLVNSIIKTIEANYVLIDSINRKVLSTSTRKTNLRKLIGNKFLYDFFIDNKSKFNEIVELSASLILRKQELAVKKATLPTTTVVENIAKLFNLFLHQYLRLMKYKAKSLDGKLVLMLDGENISNNTSKISEGEKTMIGLCYFLASSIKTLNSLDKYKDSMFIIDDPISSMSYGYFFGACNLLKFFEHIIIKELWNETSPHIDQYDIQKIILTHNTQLFNMLSSQVFKQARTVGYYNLTQTGIDSIPDGRLLSEFEIALSNIKLACTSPLSFNTTISNDLRRFFETIRHFYGYRGDFNAEVLKKIFPKFTEATYPVFFSVINYYSHGNPESYTDPLPTEFIPFTTQFKILIEDSQFSEMWDRI